MPSQPPPDVAHDETPVEQRRHELRVFLFLTIILAPMLAVALVGGTGFLIWIFQMFAGPPGPAS